jgi:hypothetical protein
MKPDKPFTLRLIEIWSEPRSKVLAGFLLIGILAVALIGAATDHGFATDPMGGGWRPGWECNNQLGSVCVRDVKHPLDHKKSN